MASLSDIRNKPKFFTLKKNANLDKLCPTCKHHKNIIAVKWGCDYIITTDLTATAKQELKTHLHIWCEDPTDLKEAVDYTPPECFREYQDAGYV